MAPEAPSCPKLYASSRERRGAQSPLLLKLEAVLNSLNVSTNSTSSANTCGSSQISFVAMVVRTCRNSLDSAWPKALLTRPPVLSTSRNLGDPDFSSPYYRSAAEARDSPAMTNLGAMCKTSGEQPGTKQRPVGPGRPTVERPQDPGAASRADPKSIQDFKDLIMRQS